MAEESNNVSAAAIERIVRDVLAQLAAEKGGKPNEITVAGRLTVSERLVTLAALERRLDGVRELVVPAKAVITPAARDRLRELKIGLAFEQTSPGPVIDGPTIVLGIAETNYEAAGLVEALSREGLAIERLAKTGLVTVVGEMCDEVHKGGKPAVLLTTSREAALCLANRQRGVRAVAVHDLGALRKSVAAVGANFLVIDPSGKGLSVLARLVREFVAAPKHCPAELAAILGA